MLRTAAGSALNSSRAHSRILLPSRAALPTPDRRIALATTAAALACCAAYAAFKVPGLQSLPRLKKGPSHQPLLKPRAEGTPRMQGVSRLFGGGGGGVGGGTAPRSGQDRLVDYLIASDLVKTPRVEAALRGVDRKRFVDPTYAAPAEAYQDTPLPIGYGQTVSAPHMHAICLELLERHLQPGARALDIGSGSGYLAAAMAIMVSPEGSVLGVEKVPELAARSVESISAANPGLLPAGAVAGEARRRAPRVEGEAPPLLEIVHGNVLARGFLESEPQFDAIHVGAAADELHEALVTALAPGGRMVIPLGPRYATQVLTVVDKSTDGTVSRREVLHVGYVPLTRPSEAEDGYHAREPAGSW